MINDKLKNVNHSLAKCCNPISGDAVFGFVTVGKGITIHRVNCPNAAQMLEKYSYRVIEVKWQDAEAPTYITNVKVVGTDTIGIIGELTDVISKDLKVNMLSFKVETGKGQFEAKIKVQVRNNEHLDELLHKLVKVKGISKASRV
jgi:GTP pyrophosphokinase